MATEPNLLLTISDKNEILRSSRGKQSAIAALETDPKTGKITLVWGTQAFQDGFHKSVQAMLDEEKIKVETVLIKGQVPDVVPASAPPPPPKHKMQGDKTPAYLEWLEKWKPIEFQNLLGVRLKDLAPGETPPKNPRDLWIRSDVIRTDTRPTLESKGGQYKSTRFIMRDQIIARARTHMTFDEKEIYRGAEAADQAEPYADPYLDLARMDKVGTIEIVSVKDSAATAGSVY